LSVGLWQEHNGNENPGQRFQPFRSTGLGRFPPPPHDRLRVAKRSQIAGEAVVHEFLNQADDLLEVHLAEQFGQVLVLTFDGMENGLLGGVGEHSRGEQIIGANGEAGIDSGLDGVRSQQRRAESVDGVYSRLWHLVQPGQELPPLGALGPAGPLVEHRPHAG